MSQENVEIVRAAFDAFERDDTDGVLSLCDPEIEITQAADLLGAPQHHHGHAGVLEAVAVWVEQWDDYRIEVISMTDLGDQVMVKVVGLEGNKIKLSRRAVLRDQKQKQEQKG